MKKVVCLIVLSAMILSFNLNAVYANESTSCVHNCHVRVNGSISPELYFDKGDREVSLMLVKNTGSDEINISDIGYMSQIVTKDGKYSFSFDFDKFTFDDNGFADNYKLRIFDGEKIINDTVVLSDLSDISSKWSFDINKTESEKIECSSAITDLYNVSNVSFDLILASYKNDGSLLNIEKISSSSTSDIVGHIFNQGDDATKMKVFMFDKLNNIIPLYESKEYFVSPFINEKKYNLWEENIPYYNESYNTSSNKLATKITPYLVSEEKCTSAVLIFPGGGYSGRADVVEGSTVAKLLNYYGISAFIVGYRVKPYQYPVELIDAQRAVRYVRYYAKDFNIDSNRIGVMGFSAGGHLAMLATENYDLGKSIDEAQDEIDLVSSRPDFSILSYPVITMGDKTHKGSKTALLGTDPDTELVDKLSGEKNVHAGMPPIFMWHCKNDTSVNYENTTDFAKSIDEFNASQSEENQIKYEMHIYDAGYHGMGIGGSRILTPAGKWTEELIKWFDENNFR